MAQLCSSLLCFSVSGPLHRCVLDGCFLENPYGPDAFSFLNTGQKYDCEC